MKKQINKIIIFLVAILGFTSTAFALPYFSSHQTLLPFLDSSYDLGTSTKKWRNLYVDSFNLSGVAVNSLLSTNSSGVVVATSTPTFGYFNATSTTATSTISGNLKVSGNLEVTGTSLLSIVTTGNLDMSGNLTFTPDNTYDIGASGATRPRTIYLGSFLNIGNSAA